MDIQVEIILMITTIVVYLLFQYRPIEEGDYPVQNEDFTSEEFFRFALISTDCHEYMVRKLKIVKCKTS